jgi:hypothetical protein
MFAFFMNCVASSSIVSGLSGIVALKEKSAPVTNGGSI